MENRDVTVLVVSPIESELEFINKALTSIGYTVFPAKDGYEGLRYFLNELQIDILICDLMTPGIDGIELCRQIRALKNTPYVYMIIITNYSQKDEWKQGFEAGIDVILHKPVDADILNFQIKTGIRIIHLERELAEERAKVFQSSQAINDPNTFLRRTMQSYAGSKPNIEEMLELLIEEKKSAETLFRNVLNTSPDSITITRWDGTFYYVNQGMLDLSGFEKEELIGKKSPEITVWLNRNDRDTFLKLLERDGTVRNFKANFKRKNGKALHGLVSANFIEVNGEQCVLSITRDIGELQKTREELKDSNEKLNQIQKLEIVGTLASGIAHDFNNILIPIIILTEMLLEQDFPPKVKEDLTSILNAGKRARKLVSQILSFSRKNEKQMEPMNLHPILNEVIKLTRATLPTNIDISYHIDETCEHAMIDAVQYQQIIMNLISNAFHAMEDSGGVLTISLFPEMVATNSGDEKKHICLEVKDDGIGMDKETQDRIFDPYFTTKSRDKGTGLGLSVAHGLVKSFQGEITVESSKGRGTTFRVYLPAIQDPHPDSTNTRQLIDVVGHQENILVVDDDVIITDLIEALLTDHGFITTCFNESRSALEAFKQNPEGYDMLLTDLMMPGLTGERLCMEIHRLRPEIPKMLITGYNKNKVLKCPENYCFDTVLVKPFNKIELLNAVGQLLQ